MTHKGRYLSSYYTYYSWFLWSSSTSPWFLNWYDIICYVLNSDFSSGYIEEVLCGYLPNNHSYLEFMVFLYHLDVRSAKDLK